MYYIGVDVGGMSIKGGLVSKDGKIVAKYTVPTNVYDKDYSISEDIRKVIEGTMAEGGVTVKDIIGIGIGQPGAVDSVRGVIRYSNNIALENVPVVDELKRYFDLPIKINNDANCAALGEQVFGAGKGYNDVVFVTLGTGVGGGFIINGKLFEGRECAGAEPGHMVIVADGERCNCGRRGCWEAYASVSALIRQTKAAMEKAPSSLMHEEAAKEGKVSGMTAFVAAKRGDKEAQKVVDTYIRYVGEGLVNLANIFRPDVILLGGAISKEKERLTVPLQKMMDEESFGAKFNPRVEVKIASLQNDAGILGAAALLLD